MDRESPRTTEPNRLPEISLGKMGLFKISRELQFGAYNLG